MHAVTRPRPGGWQWSIACAGECRRVDICVEGMRRRAVGLQGREGCWLPILDVSGGGGAVATGPRVQCWIDERASSIMLGDVLHYGCAARRETRDCVTDVRGGV